MPATTEPRPPRVMIVEDNLRDDRGHFASFVRTLAEALVARGFAVEVWAHQHAAPAVATAGAPLRRVFPRGWIEAACVAGRWRRRLAVAGHNLDLVWRLWRDGAFSAAPRIAFATTGTVYHFAAWRLWLALTPRQHRLIVFVVDLPWLIDRRRARRRLRAAAWLYRAMLRTFRGPVRAGRCHFVAENLFTARMIRQLGATAVKVAPVPLAADMLDVPLPRPAAGASPLRLGFLGRPALEKGIDRLIAAIRWRRHQPGARPAVFVFQWFDGPGIPSESKQQLAALRAERPDEIEIVDGALSPADYAALVGRLDALLLPYAAREYRERGSGVAAEAFCSGRPIVCTTGTLTARALREWGAGIVCPEGPAETLAAAIDELIRSYDALLAEARQKMPRARAAHSCQQLLAQLPPLAAAGATASPAARPALA